MPDKWDDELELDELAEPADDTEARKERLRTMAQRGGVTGQLASELLVAAEEREARAERERLANEASAAADEGFELFDSALLNTRLTAQAGTEREAADAAYLETKARALRAEHGDERAEHLMVHERAALAEMHAFMGDPGPMDVRAYREYEEAVFAAERGALAARDALIRGRSIEEDARDAEELNRRFLEGEIEAVS
jgi:hypothetical protein